MIALQKANTIDFHRRQRNILLIGVMRVVAAMTLICFGGAGLEKLERGQRTDGIALGFFPEDLNCFLEPDLRIR